MKAHLAKLITLMFLLGAASAQSQTLNWASLTGSDIVDSKGVVLDSNTYVFEIGAFTAGFVPVESNISQWDSVSNWHVFSTAAYSGNSLDGWVFTGMQTLQNVPEYASLFQGLEAYIFVRNTTDTEYFLARPAATDSWIFPALATGVCASCPKGITTWSVSDLGSVDPVWGSQGGNEGGGTGTYGNHDLQTYAVPEAGSSLLAMFGCGLLLFRRRRGLG
ncbi:MAG: hypothetical protein ABI600_20245 [Luteolibacter sp.]